MVNPDLPTLDNVEDYLTPMTNGYLVQYRSSDSLDKYLYAVEFAPFRMYQYVNGILSLVVNPTGTLWGRTGGCSDYRPTPTEVDSDGWPILKQGDCSFDVGLGFWLPSEYIYGLPGRESDFNLQTTEVGVSEPYRLFNRDLDPHAYDNIQELYGSIPYVTYHEEDKDASIAWMNSADTWVDFWPMEISGQRGTYTSFVSEFGSVDFFIFASATHPDRVQQRLAEVTGTTTLPPFQTLGFHFSKWAPVSADEITMRSKNFTDTGFPVDVLWLDIEHALWADKETAFTKDYRWFTFNPHNFTTTSLDAMKAEIAASKRRLVTIIDPHINVNDKYWVFEEGNYLQDNP